MKRTDKAAQYAILMANCTAYVREVKPQLLDAIQVYQLMAPLCENEMQEGFYVILLNAKNRPMKAPVRVTHGLVNMALAHPRETFRLAILEGAVNIILAHNHPSGDPTPSPEDIRLTNQMIEAGKIIDIKVLDHVVIGTPSNMTAGYVSMRACGLASFL